MHEEQAGDVDYDGFAAGYARHRRPDPRIASRIEAALGPAHTVLNVGAGAGSYEPGGRLVVALEPSAAMRSQRPLGGLPAIAGVAESLPFDDDSFDAAMAVLTIHQWRDTDQGLRELRRVSRGPVVILTFDPGTLPNLWLNDYIPELYRLERSRFPSIEHICSVLGPAEVLDVATPLDCTDGFAEAYYGRPEAILDPAVRQAQSGWTFLDSTLTERCTNRLRRDTTDGTWDRLYGHLRTQPTYDGAIRIVVGKGGNHAHEDPGLVAQTGSIRRHPGLPPTD